MERGELRHNEEVGGAMSLAAFLFLFHGKVDDSNGRGGCCQVRK
jgi:hypothetical protein